MTIREALLAMGYQERKPGHWLKPIGFQCFSYHEARNAWENWFNAADGSGVALYGRKSLKSDEAKFGPYLDQLKHIECWTRTDIYPDSRGSHFELSAFDL